MANSKLPVSFITFRYGSNVYAVVYTVPGDEKGWIRYFGNPKQALNYIAEARASVVESSEEGFMVALIGDVLLDFRVHEHFPSNMAIKVAATKLGPVYGCRVVPADKAMRFHNRGRAS